MLFYEFVEQHRLYHFASAADESVSSVSRFQLAMTTRDRFYCRNNEQPETSILVRDRRAGRGSPGIFLGCAT
jgi:hypothetical protein